MSISTSQPSNCLGVDVAHHDGNVEWAKALQGGVTFGFIKATEGTSYTDTRFFEEWKEMASVGITRGAYHFYRGGFAPGIQSAHFIEVLTRGGFQKSDLPPVLDIENPDGASKQVLIAGAKAWLAAVEKAFGKVPIIYTGPSFWDTYMSAEFGRYPIWIANYTRKPTPWVPKGWKDWDFWQYNSGESGAVHVPGISGAVDINRYNGTHEQLVQRFQLRG